MGIGQSISQVKCQLPLPNKSGVGKVAGQTIVLHSCPESVLVYAIVSKLFDQYRAIEEKYFQLF